ncbi:M15 family metallopeptidase [Cellulomonas fimi]|uniref:Peptidase M15B and M15C DD-carboxypeptidase VanY/endolysin n=1 Tax=Cellulomonas fimi (strain ATCC 484 / DSM 20113 / JCM 1341 / CCUG 24087 / LMG 16345 / NBRC 15513 / NCIMB 8980 / NCTC 7547 / NRS-133) TaxID=590998 RepID=F4GYW8_CELFA|nr:M15 family metallopeptidase [Cellulomonas fimi]AEE45958.1 peptidase M15B and M15C DD-carboxypeptidase VanY/endolysin [Cellulomonas fimi ATCC 484]NNH06544.1 peptidase M15 [Cellulomonas fimi]VEH31116.1 D-alanyl-D-alanine carboxypeptidase [Cellulomonas fimi]
MDGIVGIAQRMAEIRSGLQAVAPATPTSTPATLTAATASSPSSATAFAAALDTAVSQDLGTSTARTADGVPADLARYGNGRIPADALATVSGTSHRLWAPAAAAFDTLRAAAARDGVRIGITDSYRSYDAQVDVAARKGLYSQGGLAAAPGTSPHGWGLAVDLDLDDRAQAWMRANAGTYGFAEDTPREPWHWVYQR